MARVRSGDQEKEEGEAWIRKSKRKDGKMATMSERGGKISGREGGRGSAL